LPNSQAIFVKGTNGIFDFVLTKCAVKFYIRHSVLFEPNPDKPKPKIFATKTLRHKGYIYYSFFVPWCLSGRMGKVLPQKAKKITTKELKTI